MSFIERFFRRNKEQNLTTFRLEVGKPLAISKAKPEETLTQTTDHQSVQLEPRIDALLQKYHGASSETARVVLEELVAMGESAVPHLLTVFDKGKNSSASWTLSGEAAEVLGHVGDIRAKERLLEALKSERTDVHVKLSIARALTKMGATEAVDILKEVVVNAGKEHHRPYVPTWLAQEARLAIRALQAQSLPENVKASNWQTAVNKWETALLELQIVSKTPTVADSKSTFLTLKEAAERLAKSEAELKTIYRTGVGITVSWGDKYCEQICDYYHTSDDAYTELYHYRYSD